MRHSISNPIYATVLVHPPHPRRTLGALAEKCHAFAKALHYKELEFGSAPEAAVEALISINNQLRQPEAAVGILTVAQRSLAMDLKVQLWFQNPNAHTPAHSGGHDESLAVILEEKLYGEWLLLAAAFGDCKLL